MGPTRIRTSKPIIAAIEGSCVAGGLELALWCDIRVAGEGALFGFHCRRWGVPLVDGGSERLQRVVGPGPAREILLTGRGLDVEEATRLGLVTQPGGTPIPRGGALEAAMQLADEIAHSPQRCMRNDRMSSILSAEGLRTTSYDAAGRPRHPGRAPDNAPTDRWHKPRANVWDARGRSAEASVENQDFGTVVDPHFNPARFEWEAGVESLQHGGRLSGISGAKRFSSGLGRHGSAAPLHSQMEIVGENAPEQACADTSSGDDDVVRDADLLQPRGDWSSASSDDGSGSDVQLMRHTLFGRLHREPMAAGFYDDPGLRGFVDHMRVPGFKMPAVDDSLPDDLDMDATTQVLERVYGIGFCTWCLPTLPKHVRQKARVAAHTLLQRDHALRGEISFQEGTIMRMWEAMVDRDSEAELGGQSPTVRAVVFDAGGVLLPSPLQALRELDNLAGLPPGMVLETLASPSVSEAYSSLETGRGDPAKASQRFVDAFDQALDDALAASGDVAAGKWPADEVTGQLVLDWIAWEAIARYDRTAAMRTVLHQLSEHGVPTAILTNDLACPPGSALDVLQQRALEHLGRGSKHLPVIVRSTAEGVAKPNPEIYELTLERLNEHLCNSRHWDVPTIEPGEVGFVDDMQRNLDAALSKEVGWGAVHRVRHCPGLYPGEAAVAIEQVHRWVSPLLPHNVLHDAMQQSLRQVQSGWLAQQRSVLAPLTLLIRRALLKA